MVERESVFSSNDYFDRITILSQVVSHKHLYIWARWTQYVWLCVCVCEHIHMCNNNNEKTENLRMAWEEL